MYVHCPKCGNERSKQRTRTLSIRPIEDLFELKCFHADSCIWNTPTKLTSQELSRLDIEEPEEQPEISPAEIPDDKIPKDTKESVYYKYRDSEGKLICLIHRINTLEGKKIFPMYFNGTDLVYGMPRGKFLYNTDLLLKYPDLPVLVVEGEKTAEAAQQAMIQNKKKVIVTTWPLGCSNIFKGNWSLLVGREVTLWPDNDDQGREAMNKIKEILLCLK